MQAAGAAAAMAAAHAKQKGHEDGRTQAEILAEKAAMFGIKSDNAEVTRPTLDAHTVRHTLSSPVLVRDGVFVGQCQPCALLPIVASFSAAYHRIPSSPATPFLHRLRQPQEIRLCSTHGSDSQMEIVWTQLQIPPPGPSCLVSKPALPRFQQYMSTIAQPYRRAFFFVFGRSGSGRGCRSTALRTSTAATTPIGTRPRSHAQTGSQAVAVAEVDPLPPACPRASPMLTCPSDEAGPSH